jgi:hypothetical protein
MEGSDLVRGVTSREAFDWPQEDPDEFGVALDRLPEAAPEDCRLRLRHEVEHPAEAERAWLRRARLPGDDPGSRAARHQPGRRLPEQRPRRIPRR